MKYRLCLPNLTMVPFCGFQNRLASGERDIQCSLLRVPSLNLACSATVGFRKMQCCQRIQPKKINEWFSYVKKRVDRSRVEFNRWWQRCSTLEEESRMCACMVMHVHYVETSEKDDIITSQPWNCRRDWNCEAKFTWYKIPLFCCCLSYCRLLHILL